MTWFSFRYPRLPAEVAEACSVRSRDRVLAWSELAGGGVAVATGTDLRLLSALGELSRRPWGEVDRVVWDADSRTLAVWWAGRRQPLPLELREIRRFPEVVQDRVRSSIVMSRQVELDDGGGVVVAVRRGPDGTLRWQFSADPGVRLTDPVVETRIGPVVRMMAEDVGLEVPGTVE